MYQYSSDKNGKRFFMIKATKPHNGTVRDALRSDGHYSGNAIHVRYNLAQLNVSIC